MNLKFLFDTRGKYIIDPLTNKPHFTDENGNYLLLNVGSKYEYEFFKVTSVIVPDRRKRETNRADTIRRVFFFQSPESAESLMGIHLSEEIKQKWHTNKEEFQRKTSEEANKKENRVNGLDAE